MQKKFLTELENFFEKMKKFEFSIFAKISIKKLFFQLLTKKNEFFGQCGTFFVPAKFFIRLLVFAVRAPQDLHFAWFSRKFKILENHAKCKS